MGPSPQLKEVSSCHTPRRERFFPHYNESHGQTEERNLAIPMIIIHKIVYQT